jgi:hypothetical protein
MAIDSVAEKREELEPEKVEQNLERSMWLSSGSLALAAIEAVCVFLVSASGLAAMVGGSAIILAQGILFFHSAAIRLPILALATIGAFLNLGLMWNQARLRNAPAAKWRKQLLTSKEISRVRLVVSMSMLTLLCVAAELYFHYRFHGSAFS